MIPYNRIPFPAVSSLLSPILWTNAIQSDSQTNTAVKTDYQSISKEDVDDQITQLNKLETFSINTFQNATEVVEESEFEREVNQASKLLVMALRSRYSENPGNDEKLQKAITVHSLARILCAALPENLTDAEVCEIRASLPDEVLKYPQATMEEPYAPQNKLEELVVTIVRAFFIGLKTAAPYTKEILLVLAREERKYHISEYLFAAGLSTAQTLCGNVIMQKVLGKTKWVASSVLRGVSHGMSVMIEEPRTQKQRYRKSL
jgi:hypothetical protein